MLTKEELVNWSEKMFNDRVLTQEEQEDEIKKFREGVAPLYPSFIINQEEIVAKLKKSFNELYSKSRVMESHVIVGNPGDGKSHILNIIYSYLRNARNNIVINERTQGFGSKFDMVNLILNKINSPLILKVLVKKIQEVGVKNNCKDEYLQINNIADYFHVSFNLAKLLWKISFSTSELDRVKSLNILTSRDTSKTTLLSLEVEDFNRKEDVLAFFYIMMDILKEQNIYIVILIEELEHIFKWEKKHKLEFYEQLKEFIDNSQKLGNLCVLMFSTYVLNDEYAENDFTQDIYSQDPALYSRLKPKVLKIKRISSKSEIEHLVEKLIERYKKIYGHDSIDLEKIVEQINSNSQKEKTYRYYIQSAAYLLDKINAGETNNVKGITPLMNENKNQDNISFHNKKKKLIHNVIEEIQGISSLALKKKILLSIEKLLELNSYKITGKEIKKSFLHALPKNKRNSRMFFLDYSPINKVQDKYKALIDLPTLSDSLKCDKNNLYFIYLKERVTNNTEEKLQDYNPAINLVALKNEDIIELMLLLEDSIDINEKQEIGRELASLFKLETGEINE